MYSARQGPVKEEGEYDARFYENASDALSQFRKAYGGAYFRDENKDPFGLDPDIIQSKRTDKLANEMQRLGIE